MGVAYRNLDQLIDAVKNAKLILDSNGIDHIDELTDRLLVRVTPFVMFCMSREVEKISIKYIPEADLYDLVAYTEGIEFYTTMSRENKERLGL